MTEPEAKKAVSGIEIFRESGAPSLRDSGMMEHNNGEAANAGIQRMMDAGLSHSNVLKALYKSDDPNGPSLSYAWFKGNYALPLHTHDTDCLYYIISGEIRLGNEVLKAGDGFMLRAHTPYQYRVGPDGVEVLEFRPTSKFDIRIKDGTPRYWDKLVDICAQNRNLWEKQDPPVRRPLVSSER